MGVVDSTNCACVDGGMIITELYESLKQLGVEISLSSDGAKSEISNDSDWHRTKIGYSVYESFLVINKKWLVSLGQKSDSYAAEMFDKDLFVQMCDESELMIDEDELKKYAKTSIRRASYFKRSFLVSTADGRLCVSPSYPYLGRVADLVDKSIYSKPQYNEKAILLSSLSYPITKKAQYLGDLSEKLFEIFKEILQ